MSVERLLTNVLRLYQDVHDDARTEQLYSTTTTLLTNLTNPLNISLLTTQVLSAPAIWDRRDGIKACYRIISIYNTAARHIRKNELENAKHKGVRPPSGSGMRTETWTSAVLKGVDDHTPRWRHLLVSCGLLIGLENKEQPALGRSMRNTLEQAVITAANLSLQPPPAPQLPAPSGPVMLALNYAFPLLSESARTSINCDGLVKVGLNAMFGPDGLQDGLFLAPIDLDMRQSGQRFMWLNTSPSFLLLQQLEQKPLVSGLGPLSRILTFAIEKARDPRIVLQAQDDLIVFTERLFAQWQAAKFSELEISEEEVFLTPETLKGPWPALWQLLKKIMYGVVAVLQAVVARSLLDPHLRNDATAPIVASKSLKILRNLYFISSRNGSDAFQVYSFTYLTSLDNLARYADACVSFLQETRSPNPQVIPAHPLHRTLDLFYLNVAEHLPLNMPPEACDSLIVQPATTYLTHAAPLSPRMVELFEAAHSAVLSVLSCPHNAPITAQVAPFYAENLLSAFPAYISPRQFRLAFKTLMQILSPPFPISESHPQLAETLLEMVRFRSTSASNAPLSPSPENSALTETKEDPMSEQSTLVLTLIDSLPFLHLHIFEDWLTLAALAVNEIADTRMRETTKRRFWDVLVSGEMDVERAAIGVAWWGTKGGREAVLYGGSGSGLVPAPPETYMMSGAIVTPSSKL